MISKPVPKDPSQPVNPLIEENCPCTNNCPRHGNCFECLANHRDNHFIPPACIRIALEEHGMKIVSVTEAE